MACGLRLVVDGDAEPIPLGRRHRARVEYPMILKITYHSHIHFFRAVKNMSFLSVSAHVSKDKYVSIPHCPKFRPGPTSERPRICRCALRSGT